MQQPAGTLLVALGASCWGLDTLLRQPLTRWLSATEIVLYEHLIVSALLLPVLGLTHKNWRSLEPREWLAVLWVAWGGSALGTICFTEAVKLGNPTSVVFLQKLQPLFAVVLARGWLQEREPSRAAFWIRVGLAVVAAWMISFGDVSWGQVWDVRGEAAFLALAAAAIWGSCTVVGRYALRTLPFTALTALRVSLAVPLLLCLTLAGPGPSHMVWPRNSQWQSLLWMAFVPGLLGLLLYYRGLSKTPASVATLAELFFPATAAVVNWQFLGTRITTLQITGLLLLWVAVLQPPQARDSPEQGLEPGAAKSPELDPDQRI